MPAQSLELVLRQIKQILVTQRHAPRSWRLQREDRPSERALSTAALSDEAEGPAATNSEINAVDRAQQPLSGNLVMPDKTDCLDEGFAHEALQQATSWS